jgi:hypothetical protein
MPHEAMNLNRPNRKPLALFPHLTRLALFGMIQTTPLKSPSLSSIFPSFSASITKIHIFTQNYEAIQGNTLVWIASPLCASQ